jgi:hypothetical protein
MPPHRPLEDRFWAKVDKDGPIPAHRPELGPCWIWTRNTNGHYGKIASGDGKLLSVHRLSWEMHYGLVPEGMLVCHHCDNQICVRPDHLFLGSHKVNTQDMMQKGRHHFGVLYGEDIPWARLTWAQVAEIRSQYPAKTQLSLAQEFGVGRSTIAAIVNGYTWVVK